MVTIAFVTTCKGRLHHIKQTLPLMAAQNPDEIIVVDYGCPDGVGNWVEANHPSVKVVRVNDDAGFSAARARNIGVSATSSSWLCLIDADVKTSAGWLDHMRQIIRPGQYYRAGLIDGVRDSETFGTLFCAREDFDAIGGYDEVMRGWGAEDKELYARLARQGMEEKEYPARFVAAIRHGDQERIAFQEVRNKKLQDTINVCYAVAKGFIMDKLNVSSLSLRTRENLMVQVRDQFLGNAPQHSNAISTALRKNSIQVFMEVEGSVPAAKPSALGCRILRRRRYVFFGPSIWIAQ